MSWSLDARRPKPDIDPEGWCKFWEEELEWSFSRPEERLIEDSDSEAYMVMLSEQYLALFHGLRLEIAKQRQHMTSIWLEKHSQKDPVEKIWTSKTQKEREKIIIEALVEYATSGREGSLGEDQWQWCPEVTRKDMCGEDGQEFIRLLNHFKLSDPLSTPSLDFPVLPERRVWRLFDISMDDAANACRPEGVRGYHNLVIVSRHVFLTNFVLRVLLLLVGKKMTTTFVKAPKIKKTAEYKEMVKAHKAWKPLPAWVQSVVKEEKKKNKEFEKTMVTSQRCAGCFKQTDKASDLKACGGCSKVGRRILYCSRECQVQDYKHGRPPHKQICSKPLREAPLDLATESKKSDTFPLYTSTPTPALALQVYFLRRDEFQWDYCFVCDDGRPLCRTFHGSGKAIFLEARKKAFEQRDLASIAVMELMLNAQPTVRDGILQNYRPQIEKEYEVDIDMCRTVAMETSEDYKKILRSGVVPRDVEK